MNGQWTNYPTCVNIWHQALPSWRRQIDALVEQVYGAGLPARISGFFGTSKSG